VSRPSALGSFARGVGASISKPYLAVALWLIQLALAAVLVLPLGNALHTLLDRDPSSDRMVARPDYGWWETVTRVHPDVLGALPEAVTSLLSPEGLRSSQVSTLRGAGAAAVGLGALAVILHAFALGGLLGTLREPQASLVTFGREGLRRLPAFLAFTLAAVAGALTAYRWLFVETGAVMARRGLELATETQVLLITLGRLLLLGIALAAIKLLVDSVRSIWVARPDLPPVSRFLAGVGAALGRPLRLLGVLALWGVSIAGLYGLWLFLDPSAGGEARLALLPLIATQQVFVFLRCLLKVGYYAAVSEVLTKAPAPEYAYLPRPEGAASAAPAEPQTPDSPPDAASV
jgi:hypothetical protein